MISVFLFSFMLFTSGSLELTRKDGLYILIDGKKCQANEIQFERKKYCVPDRPIIPVEFFIKITKMRKAGETLFFDVDLDKAASKKLNLIQSKLHRPKFALILDDQIKGWVEIDSDGMTSKLRFYSTSFGLAIIEVHQYLQSIIKTEKE